MEKQYTYRSLSRERSIRLLRIDNYTPSETCKLTGSLDTFEFDKDCPLYDALSYTWGPPLDTRESEAEYGPAYDVTIFLESGHGHQGAMSIARNLFEALVHLWEIRTDPSSFQPRDTIPRLMTYVWTDAICINQLDDAEKSYQVAFMGEIYAKAETVAAWTGQDDGTYADVAQFHLECSEKVEAWMQKYLGLPSPAYCEVLSEG